MAKGSSAMSVVRVFLAALLAFACAQAPMAAHGGETASTHKGSADLTLPFGLGKGLHAAWGNGAIPGLYTPDRSEGAFRFTCGGDGPLASDDPVVYPGQPGKSHL